MLSIHTTPSTRHTGFSERQRRIYDFLDRQYVAVLSTVTPDGDPHGAVVYYVIDTDFTVWILTKADTHKYDNLIRNHHVTLTVFDITTQSTATVLATATEEPATHTVSAVANRIFQRVRQTERNVPPIMKLMAGRFTTFCLQPVQIRMAMYSRPDSGDSDELFESIESFELKDG